MSSHSLLEGLHTTLAFDDGRIKAVHCLMSGCNALIPLRGLSNVWSPTQSSSMDSREWYVDLKVFGLAPSAGVLAVINHLANPAIERIRLVLAIGPSYVVYLVYLVLVSEQLGLDQLTEAR